MVIVIATRVDLRHESVMADEAFALSPISARAVQPSEADYDAIREAFMETSRGRWFLGEFAKRNRNADTSMVLGAVSRIEETLAAHRQPPAPDDRLAEALAAIRGAVNRAAETAAATFDGAALEAHLAPIRIGTRIIKEISWRWREIGADGRICDLIDSQVDAIDAACTQLAETDPRVALRAAFEIIRSEVEAFRDGDDSAPSPVVDALRPVTPMAKAPAPVAAAPAVVNDEPPTTEVETAFNEPELPTETAAAEAETDGLSQEEADAQDEALLDIVAM